MRLFLQFTVMQEISRNCTYHSQYWYVPCVEIKGPFNKNKSLFRYNRHIKKCRNLCQNPTTSVLLHTQEFKAIQRIFLLHCLLLTSKVTGKTSSVLFKSLAEFEGYFLVIFSTLILMILHSDLCFDVILT